MSYSPNPPKVLIIDDDPFALATLREYLKDVYALDLYPSAELGFQRALTTHPDIILLDLDMPEMSGLEILGALRSLNIAPAIPVIILTAHDRPDLRQHCATLNAYAYLIKPCNAKHLTREIGKALNQANACNLERVCNL